MWDQEAELRGGGVKRRAKQPRRQGSTKEGPASCHGANKVLGRRKVNEDLTEEVVAQHDDDGDDRCH
jgi:hypothetical protein